MLFHTMTPNSFSQMPSFLEEEITALGTRSTKYQTNYYQSHEHIVEAITATVSNPQGKITPLSSSLPSFTWARLFSFKDHKLLAAWIEENSQDNVWIKGSWNLGGRWDVLRSIALTHTSYSSNIHISQAAMNQNGEGGICWEINDLVKGMLTSQIQISTYSEGAWSPITALATEEEIGFPQMAVDEKGNFLVVWCNEDNETKQIFAFYKAADDEQGKLSN